MNYNEICEKIMEIVENIIEEDNEKICWNKWNPADDLDSIQIVGMIIEIESFFNIEFKDEDYDLENMSSIYKISNIVQKYVKDYK